MPLPTHVQQRSSAPQMEVRLCTDLVHAAANPLAFREYDESSAKLCSGRLFGWAGRAGVPLFGVLVLPAGGDSQTGYRDW